MNKEQKESTDFYLGYEAGKLDERSRIVGLFLTANRTWWDDIAKDPKAEPLLPRYQRIIEGLRK